MGDFLVGLLVIIVVGLVWWAVAKSKGNGKPTAEPWRTAVPARRELEPHEAAAEVRRLKKAGLLDEALVVAQGALESMKRSVARGAPVLDYYVVEVATLLGKMERYGEQVQLLQEWVDGPLLRSPEVRLDFQKRLARAKMLLAKQGGTDPSEHAREWKRLVAVQKEENAKAAALQKSRAAAAQKARAYSGGSWIPDVATLRSVEFVAIDFETANRVSGASACQIAAVRVRSGVIVDRLTSYLKPPPELSRFEFTYLHGISAADVARAPNWAQLVPRLQAMIGDLPVYAHNASFDSKVWRELDAYYSVRSLPGRFFCTYRTSQEMVFGLPNYKLPTVVGRLDPRFKLDHHRADSDAEACARIVIALQRQS